MNLNKVITALAIVAASLQLTGCTSVSADNVYITAVSSSENALTDNQPVVTAEVALQGVSDQKLKIVLQKEAGASWVDESAQDLAVGTKASAAFDLDEKSAGIYKYKVLAKSTDGQTLYKESKPFTVQIDDLKQLTRSLFYGQQQACISSYKICGDYIVANDYPGLWAASDIRNELEKYALDGLNPDLTTLIPDPRWVLTNRPGNPKPLLDISKPLPGETYTVTVTSSFSNSQATAHVTYFNGKLYFYLA